MRVTIAAFGLELDLTLGPAGDGEDEGAALNGGTLDSDSTHVSLGPSDMFMGFTNGREDG